MKIDRDQLLAFMSGHRIMMLRKERGLSQANLARGIVSQPTFSLLETGKHPPEPELLRLLGAKLNDEVLLNYASFVEKSKDYIDIPPQEILSALLEYTAAWSEFHASLALELSQYYLNNNDLKISEKLVDLVIINKPDSPFFYQACALKGRLLLYAYNYTESVPILRKAVDAKAALSPELRARAIYNLGYAYFFQDKYDLATTYCAEAIAICQEDRSLFWLYAKALGLRGTIYRRIGRLEEAIADLDDAEVMLDKFDGNVEDKFRVRLSAVDVMECQGAFEEAESRLRFASQFGLDLESVGDISRAMYHRILARIEVRKGMYLQAETSVEAAIHYAIKADDDWSITWSLITAIGVYQNQEKRREAARRTLHIAKAKNLPVQGAIAAEALLALSDEQTSSCVIETISMYRTALLNSIYLEHVAGILPQVTGDGAPRAANLLADDDEFGLHENSDLSNQ